MASDYSPYVNTYAVRRVTFASGIRETLLRVLPQYVGGAAEAKAHAMALANRGSGAYKSDMTEQEKRERSIAVAARRARRALRWACLSIEADRLLTLTFLENIQDRARVLAYWDRFRRGMVARNPGWVFVAVLERQKRGAYHLHVAVRGKQPLKYMWALWRQIVGEGEGGVDLLRFRRRFGTQTETESTARIARYLAKYIGKEFDDTPKGARRFFGSQNRPVPTIERWWLQVKNDQEAIEMTFRLTCGGRAVGVSQWLSGDGRFYWVSGPPPLDDCPF